MASWETASDWDASQDETGTHHEQPTGTDWAAADTLEKGYPSTDPFGSSLSVYYPMDEGSGSTVNDVASGVDGTAQDTSAVGATSSGPFGNSAYDFSGASDGVSLPEDAAFEPSGSFTITFWANIESDSSAHRFAAYQTANTSYGWRVMRDNNTTGGLRFDINDGNGTNTLLSDSQWDDSNWHHCAFVYDEGNSETHIYVDGTNDGTNTGVHTLAFTTGNGGAIGDSSDNDGFQVVTADMSDWQMYHRALTSSEITDLAEAPL